MDRLCICELELLELRRLRCDLTMLYKILHGKIHLDLNNCIQLCSSVTRGNKYKLVKKQVRLDVRKYFYCDRVVNAWNSLSSNIVCSGTVHEFMRKLSVIDLSTFLKGRAVR